MVWFWWILAQWAIKLMRNPKLWQFSISYFSIPKGQMDITSLTIVRFQNLNHHYKWENVYIHHIPKTWFWPCAQKSLILTAWVTYGKTDFMTKTKMYIWKSKAIDWYKGLASLWKKCLANGMSCACLPRGKNDKRLANDMSSASLC